MQLLLTSSVLAFALTVGTDYGLKPWAENTHPTDVAKRCVEEATSGEHRYTITQGGTMDGANCRSPMGVWQPWEQTWESNRAVRMENVGETDVMDPWLFNGRNNLRTIEEIVSAVVEPGMSEREKAIALWWFETTHRFHYPERDMEVKNPVKVHNIYGYNTCGDDSQCLAGLWHAAGLRVRPARLVGHCISQVFYEGTWHLLDADMQSCYLLRDNQAVASEQDLVRDHDLIKRTHTQGILQPDSRAGNERHAAIYVYEGNAAADRDAAGSHTMQMVLRPNEAITWRWGHLDPVKYHGGFPPVQPAGLCKPAVDRVCNGLWEYRPEFSGELWKKGANTVEGVETIDTGLAAEAGATGTIVWAMSSPYVFVGGRLEVDGRGVRFAISWDGKTWEDVQENFDRMFPPEGPARYQYYLRCQLPGGARLKRLGIVSDVQMAMLALPGMVVGKNALMYTDQSPAERKVRITHDWVERSASQPPTAPSGPMFPADGGQPSGTDITFQWQVPSDPDGDRTVDYHFELSDRPDLKWPLSPNFSKLISRTADRDKAQYSLPCAGLLTPDRRYYWRVRGKDEQGVWGPWSKTWSFVPHGPLPPVDVTIDFDLQQGVGILHWKPDATGRRPVKYRVYGSDEKGFTVSDEPYQVTVGASKELPSLFSGNFVSETTATQLAVVGAAVDLSNGNKAFYRVVAVDAQGKRSGASDYTVAPRALIFSTPVVRAKVGVPYRCQVSAIRSLGDLRARLVEVKEKTNFWDVEKPKFALQQAPPWLTIDETTGLLSGTPDAPGQAEVAVVATIDREVRKLDEEQLTWGREGVTGVVTERVGSATQRFVIEVDPL